MDPDGAFTPCRCGNMQARWVNSAFGTVEIKARDRFYVRMIGMHNDFLRAGADSKNLTHEQWRNLHDELCETAHGYLFHKGFRNCPVAIIAVGEASGIYWAPRDSDSGQPSGNDRGNNVNNISGSDKDDSVRN